MARRRKGDEVSCSRDIVEVGRQVGIERAGRTDGADGMSDTGAGWERRRGRQRRECGGRRLVIQLSHRAVMLSLTCGCSNRGQKKKMMTRREKKKKKELCCQIETTRSRTKEENLKKQKINEQ